MTGRNLRGAPTIRKSRTGASARLPFSRELWMKGRTSSLAAQGIFPPLPRQRGRLRYGFVVKCHRHEGRALSLHLLSRSKSGTPRGRQVQGEGQYPLGEREARPRGRGAALRTGCSKSRIPEDAGSEPGFSSQDHCATEPSLRAEELPARLRGFKFERHGYFIADQRDPAAFNRTVSPQGLLGSATPLRVRHSGTRASPSALPSSPSAARASSR